MNATASQKPRALPKLVGASAAALLAAMLCVTPAFAGKSEAEAALTRADVKIEMVTAQAGQAGDAGDQSFNMARERLANARVAQKDDKYDTAEMLAEEAALLAVLTSERSVLAALKTSQANLARSTATPLTAQ